MANTEANMKRALALSKRDQIMEIFKDRKYQLEEIFEEGPKSSEDVALIKQCVMFVLGEVALTQAEAI